MKTSNSSIVKRSTRASTQLSNRKSNINGKIVKKAVTVQKVVAKKKTVKKLTAQKLSDQKNKSVQNSIKAKARQQKTKVIKKVVKVKQVKKKKTLISEEQEQKRREKLELQEAKKKAREEKIQAKLIKQKIFEITPNPNLPLITQNALLQVSKHHALPAQQKGKQQAKIQPLAAKREFGNKGCCIFCNNREAIQCVVYNDVEGLKKCFEDVAQISNPFQRYSVNCMENILSIAIKNKAIDIVRMIVKYDKKQQAEPLPRVKLPSVNLEKMTTGRANKFQFYFPIRQVNLSRGNKEGNNAFTHDTKMRKPEGFDYTKVFKYSPNAAILKLLMSKDKREGNDDEEGANFISEEDLKQNLGVIARTGNYELLKLCAEKALNNYSYGWNVMHKAAITQGSEAENTKGINKQRLLKKGFDLFQLSPGHLAAINPDPTIFKLFFKAYPTSNILDVESRDLVHYAAANVNSEVLKLLIAKKVELNNRDIQGYTPLMVACILGRTENAELLIQESMKIIKTLDKTSEDYLSEVSHLNFANQTGHKNKTPLHYATKYGHLNVVKLLIEESEANVNKLDSDSYSALDTAAEYGRYDIAEYLLEKGANIHGGDKQGKSPIIKAIMNGHLHIVSLLLRKGVNPNYKDSSENSILHYACGYGWLQIVKYVIEAGADPNIVNEWRMSPILLAMLKGHYGIVDYLINLPQLNAQFQDDQGRTLVSQLCMNLNEDSFKNLKFLLDTGKIDVNIKDINGLSPMHHLASNNLIDIAQDIVKNKASKVKQTRYTYRKGKKIKVKDYSYRYNRNNRGTEFVSGYFSDDKDQQEFNQKIKDLESIQIKCAEQLTKAGISLTEKTNEGNITPLFLACLSQNYSLAEWLLKKEPKAIQGTLKGKNTNILHVLSEEFYLYDKNLLRMMVDKNKAELKSLAMEYDSTGYQPYHLYFKALKEFKYAVNDLDEKQKKYFNDVLLPRILNTLSEVTQIYSKDLGYDISSYTGMTLSKREYLKEQVKEGIISQKLHDKIVSLEYELIDINNDVFKDRKQSFVPYDDILSFDPNKQKMFLCLEKSDQGINYSHKQYRYKQSKARCFKPIKVEEGGQSLDISSYYEPHTKSNVLILFLSFLKRQSTEIQEQFARLFHEILKESNTTQSKQQPVQKRGFNKLNSNNRTLITKCLQKNLVPIMKVIIDSNILDFNIVEPRQQLSPTHYLTVYGNKEMIDYVLKSKIKLDCNSKDINGNTPLHYAAKARNLYLLQKFIALGVDVNAKNKHGFTPLHNSIFSFDESKDHTPQIERELLEAGANLNIEDNDGRTPTFMLFHKLVANDKTKSVDPVNLTIVLIQSGKIKNLNHKDKHQNTILHYACQAGSTISALTLINSGADINALNLIGANSLGIALQNKRSDLSIFLIQNGCDINVNVKRLKKKDPLHYFAKNSNSSSIILPRHVYLKYTQQNKEYKNVKEYIDNNFEVIEESPFYNATADNQNGIGYLLLSRKFDLFQALVDSIRCSKIEKFVDLLENSGKINYSQTNAKGQNLLHLLSKVIDDTNYERGLDIIDMLIKKYKINEFALTKKNKNYLHYLFAGYHPKLMKAFVARRDQKTLETLLKQKDHTKCNVLAQIFKQQEYIDNFLTDQQFDFSFKKYDTTYECQNAYIDRKEAEQINLKNEGYLIPDYFFPVEVPFENFMTTLSHTVVRSLWDMKPEEKIYNAIQKFQEKGLDFEVFEGETGLTPLILSIILNDRKVTFGMIGYIYDQKEKKYTLKKPLVNINQQDKEGKTALMWAIQPTKLGCWQNYDVIEALIKQGINPEIKDKQGLNAFDYACQDFGIYTILAKSFQFKPNKNKPNFKKELPQQEEMKFGDVEDKIQLQEHFDYEDDAEYFIKQMKKKIDEKKMDVDEKKKDELQPDKHGDFENCEVQLDHNTHRLYDVVMVKIDVKKHYYGVCNFYVMQVIFDKVKKIYILWTRWGRIGDVGQYQRTPFSTLIEADAEFKKVYRQKVGAKWEEFDSYVPVPKKYVIKRIGGKVIYHKRQEKKWEYSDRQIDEKEWIIDFRNKKLVKSNLAPSLQEFVSPLVNQASALRQMQSSSVKKEFFLECLFDREQVKQMREILNDIKKIYRLMEQAKKDADIVLYSNYSEQMYELSNQYYEFGNPTQFAQGQVRTLQSDHLIEQEEKKLNLIYDMEHVTKLLFGATYRIKEINPYDYCFKSLNVKLQELNTDETDFKLITRYINNSVWEQTGYYNFQLRPTSVIQGIYKVEPKKSLKTKQQQEDSDKVFNSLHNHFMLFHGTSNANVLSILEQGLQITPTNSSGMRGQSFGKGIYLADMAKLSLNYTDSHSDDAYILVVEAALGNICNTLGVMFHCHNPNIQANDYQLNKMLKGYNSLRVMGSYGPKFEQNLVRKDGSIWPLGEVNRYELPHYKYEDKLFRKYAELRDYVKKQEEEKRMKPLQNGKKNQEEEKKANGKRANSKKPIKKRDEDIEMIDTSSKKQEEEKKQKEDAAKKESAETKPYFEPQDPKTKNPKVEPHIISYRNFPKDQVQYQVNQEPQYFVNQTEYVIFNSDQLRVRYIVHFKDIKKELSKMSTTQNGEPSSESDESEDSPMEEDD